MSSFRLDLPIDIPWTLIESSSDVMDVTWCNKRYPPPFRSSIAVYAYQPSADNLPSELCGSHVAYLKISCSISGYQPTGEEKGQIVTLAESLEVDYGDFDKIVDPYLGCYGVLLNVSVHPSDPKLQSKLAKYPRIVDFEPKTRDFYQAASETAEVLTGSVGKVTTNKSFASTDSTQSSWQTTANAKVPAADTAAATGVPVEVGATGTTGQIRTDTDQQNWGVTTDASRERREGQSTTTQLSQMYNLLTGYHAGTNRASFIMLPRPHILQPTDRRTFAQGLRVIEGIQDFFLVVIRPPDQETMKVDVLLQTGHFPEFASPAKSKAEPATDKFSFTIGPISLKGTRKSFLGVTYFEENDFSDSETHPNPRESDVFVIDTSNPIEEKKLSDDNEDLMTSGVWEIDTKIKRDGQNVIVSYTLKTDWNSTVPLVMHRKYTVPIIQQIKGSTVPDPLDMLVVQRTLCAEMRFGDCITKVDPFDRFDNIPWPVDEPGFDLPDLDLPYGSAVDVAGAVSGIHTKAPRFDFAIKKAILRQIQHTLIASGSSPRRYQAGTVGYLQTRYFQKQLARLVPARVLQRPVRGLNIVDQQIRDRLPEDITLGEMLSGDDQTLARKLSTSPRDVQQLKNRMFRAPTQAR
jgi:hypothetical protein